MSIAYTQLDDIFNESAGNAVEITEHRSQALGIQAEFEERGAAWAVPGVISGGACSIDGVDVDVAAIVAYAVGGGKLKRYEGADSVTFTGSDANDTFYIYLDPTDDVTPLTKSVSAPTDGTDCCLCQVDWNGVDTLSNIVDLREWGIFPVEFSFQVVGAVSADVIGLKILGFDFWIDTVKGCFETCGTGAGPSYVDVHAGDGGSESTIWTTQARRISIAHDDTDGAVVSGGVPEANRKLTAGQKLLVEIDAAATAAADLSVVVIGRKY